MPAYQYQHGDRPLDGYTIQRAAGRGGFGEVYYALSDSGREVALKAVQGYEDIELRGIQQCMNLKSPHLVSIFDVKHNDQGRPFVLMEFVSGPSLRELLDASPSGLGEQKTAFFLREIAKGLTYLHDAGVVHRDLKPGNVFYEDGYVKIGDYGLSKMMSAGVNSGQTITVGTVHYMAPEVGQGKYDRSIDIYALGCMLYEMLTGTTPYFGSSPTEVLMKHLSAEPDLTNVGEPFKTVIHKALAKDPAERYTNVQQMVEDVFGAAHVQQSVSAFVPESLSMVAGRVAAKAKGGSDGPGNQGATALGGSSWSQTFDGSRDRTAQTTPAENEPRVLWEQRAGKTHQRIEQHPDGSQQFHQKVGNVEQSYEVRKPRREHAEASSDRDISRRKRVKARHVADARRDPVSAAGRWFLAALTIGLITGAVGLFNLQSFANSTEVALMALFSMTASVLVAEFFRSHLSLGASPQPVGGRRFLFASCVGIAALAGAAAWGAILNVPAQVMTAVIVYLALPLCLLDWPNLTAPWRRHRLYLTPALLGCLYVWVGSWFVDHSSLVMAMGAVAGTALAAQILAPWDPTARARARAMNHSGMNASTIADNKSPQANSEQTLKSSPPKRDNTHMNTAFILERYNVSEHRRLWATLLSFGWFFGVCGLHRFYVGKIGTGLLWFFTGGFFGIGQLIDVIMIVSGQFKDKEGRTLIVWDKLSELSQMAPSRLEPFRITSRDIPYEPISSDQSASKSGVGLGRVLVGGLAALATLAAIVLGMGVALQVPQLLAANALDTTLSNELHDLFGNENWPETMQQTMHWAMLGLVGFATLLALINRRSTSLMHAGRAGLGFAGVVAAMMFAKQAVAPIAWTEIDYFFKNDKVGLGLNQIFAAMNEGQLLIAAGVLIASLTMLVWPMTNKQEDDTPVVQAAATGGA